MRRRTFLQGLVGAVALALPAACTQVTEPDDSTGSASAPVPTSSVPPSGASSGPGPAPGQFFGPPQGIVRVPVPHGTIFGLPGHDNLVALTVDDGDDPEVLQGYLELAARTGLRLTFFANGLFPSWTQHAPLLRPLVDDGQVFIGNHTFSHLDLTGLGDYGVADEVRRNEKFLQNTYGVTGRPFLRPPFGYHSQRVDGIVTDLGYPAVTMWYGSLGDATTITPRRVLAHAKQWLLPDHLVIGHANHPPVLQVMDQIVDVIRERRLQPVHLGDVYNILA